jgi:hypothetical protein
LGLLGEEMGPGVKKGKLTAYIVVERHHNMYEEKGKGVWDAAILMSLFTPIHIHLIDNQEYSGKELLLIQRYPDRAWDNSDPNVHVFGILEGENLSDGPLALTEWQPKTIWLESHAIMTVEDPSAPSEVSKHMKKRTER